jgi:hypothetical protein
MRLIVDWLKPVLAANSRLDQWVAPLGVFSKVQRTTGSILSSPIWCGAPLVAQTCQALGTEVMAPETYRESRSAQFNRHGSVAQTAHDFSTMRARKATEREPRD